MMHAPEPSEGGEPVKSPQNAPSKPSMLSVLLMPLLVTGFAVAFLWDGFVRYPQRNVAELLRRQGQSVENLPTADATLTADRAREHVAALPAGTPVSEVVARLGEPPLRAGDQLYYFGHGGALHVELRAGLVAQAAWEDAPHTATDLAVQRWIGIILAVAGVILIVRMTFTLAGTKSPAASSPTTNAAG